MKSVNLTVIVCAMILFSVIPRTMAQSLASTELPTIRVATFNVSMEAGNYLDRGEMPTGQELPDRLKSGDHPQIRNIAEIIQRVRPDVLLLNEFDYIDDPEKGVLAFIRNYLNVSQQGEEAINYDYFFIAPSNTGVDSGLDLNRDGTVSGSGDDAFGYGQYPGQYGMALLSRYPIDTDMARTFQHFLWRDMPQNRLQRIKTAEGEFWYDKQAQARLRLSSKSHWDIPVRTPAGVVHILASHPTPPVFDGPEDRNGHRNADEIRFWVDYLGPATQAGYIYDDAGAKGGFAGNRFVLLGDLNASINQGDADPTSIRALLTHSAVMQTAAPQSAGGKANSPHNRFSEFHTAAWRMRADYVLPSKAGLSFKGNGVFWPAFDDAAYRLVADRAASSDHRLVWVDVNLVD